MSNRILKESICCSDDIDRLTPFEETVFYRLLVRADDYGRLDARPGFLRSTLFVTKRGIDDEEIARAVARLAEVGLIRCYEVQGRPFLLLTGWSRHQRVRHQREKYPAPPGEASAAETGGEARPSAETGGEARPSAETGGEARPSAAIGGEARPSAAIGGEARPSAAIGGEARPTAALIQSESNPDPNLNPSGNPDPTRAAAPAGRRPPTQREVEEYCRRSGSPINPRRFYSFYTARGWMAGSTPIADWKAALHSWEQRGDGPGGERAPSGGPSDAMIARFMREEGG